MADNKSFNFGCGGASMLVLGLVLVFLKVTHNIDWGWWLVLMPFYLPITLGLVATVLFIALWIWANARS